MKPPEPYGPELFQAWLRKRVKQALLAIAILAVLAMATCSIVQLTLMPSATAYF